MSLMQCNLTAQQLCSVLTEASLKCASGESFDNFPVMSVRGKLLVDLRRVLASGKGGPNTLRPTKPIEPPVSTPWTAIRQNMDLGPIEQQLPPEQQGLPSTASQMQQTGHPQYRRDQHFRTPQDIMNERELREQQREALRRQQAAQQQALPQQQNMQGIPQANAPLTNPPKKKRGRPVKAEAAAMTDQSNLLQPIPAAPSNTPGGMLQHNHEAVATAAAHGKHALQDYQMQIMLLEQQNKKRLLMARQEQAEASTEQHDNWKATPCTVCIGAGLSCDQVAPICLNCQNTGKGEVCVRNATINTAMENDFSSTQASGDAVPDFDTSQSNRKDAGHEIIFSSDTLTSKPEMYELSSHVTRKPPPVPQTPENLLSFGGIGERNRPSVKDCPVCASAGLSCDGIWPVCSNCRKTGQWQCRESLATEAEDMTLEFARSDIDDLENFDFDSFLSAGAETTSKSFDWAVEAGNDVTGEVDADAGAQLVSSVLIPPGAKRSRPNDEDRMVHGHVEHRASKRRLSSKDVDVNSSTAEVAPPAIEISFAPPNLSTNTPEDEALSPPVRSKYNPKALNRHQSKTS
jgi:hypothetical protein